MPAPPQQVLRRALKGGDTECAVWLRQRHPWGGGRVQADYLAWRERQRALAKDVAMLEQSGWRLGGEAWLYVVQCYAETGHARECVAALQRLRGVAAAAPEALPEGVTVNVYNMVLRSLCEVGGTVTGNLSAFEAVFAEMREDGLMPNAETYRLLLRQLRKDGNRAAVRDAFTVMEKAGVPPTVHVLNELVSNSADVREALRHLAAFQKRGIHPNARTFCSVLKVCAAVGDLRTAEELFSHRTTATVDEYNSLMRVYKTASGLRGAKAVLRRMAAAGVAPDAATYAVLLAACAVDRDAAAAEGFFKAMHAAGFMKSKASIGSLMEVYAATGNAERAEQLMDWSRLAKIPPSQTTLRHYRVATGQPAPEEPPVTTAAA